MNTIKIEDWVIVCGPTGSHVAPECRTRHLSGKVESHPLRPVGGAVTTSAIVGRRGSLVVTKNGSLYELGKMREGFEAQFPGVTEWLLKALPEV